MIILTAVASHTHCHFSPPFRKQDESFVSAECHLTWNELLANGTYIRFTIRSLLVESKKNSRLYLLPWAPPSVSAEKLHFTDHLVLGAYNPLHPQNIQPVTHPRCHFAMKIKECPHFPVYPPFLNYLNNGSSCAHPRPPLPTPFFYLVNLFLHV